MTFSYQEMTTRNLGFVSAAEQEALRLARVFVCGAGGMGGACLQSLARAGVGAFEIADFDSFEVSNLNRQVFATLESLGLQKATVAAARLREINPGLEIDVRGSEWKGALTEILCRADVVVNAMDDVRASIDLYRAARTKGVTVVDAYTSVLPSVFTTSPDDPRPEERLSFGTAATPTPLITEMQINEARFCEMEYVLTHSSTLSHMDPVVLAEVLTGKRPRISFAPMVLVTGNFMAYEAIAAICGRRGGGEGRGYFFNPYTARVEHPLSGEMEVAARRAARLFLGRIGTRSLSGGAEGQSVRG